MKKLPLSHKLFCWTCHI